MRGLIWLASLLLLATTALSARSWKHATSIRRLAPDMDTAQRQDAAHGLLQKRSNAMKFGQSGSSMRFRALDLLSPAASGSQYDNQYSLKNILTRFKDNTTSTDSILMDIEELEKSMMTASTETVTTLAPSPDKMDTDEVDNQLSTIVLQLQKSFSTVSSLENTLDEKLTQIVNVDTLMDGVESQDDQEFAQAEIWFGLKEDIKTEFVDLRLQLSAMNSLLLSARTTLLRMEEEVNALSKSTGAAGKYVKLLANQLLSDNPYGMCNYTGPIDEWDPDGKRAAARAAEAAANATGSDIGTSVPGSACSSVPTEVDSLSIFAGSCTGGEAHGESCYLTCGNGYLADGDMQVTCENGRYSDLQGSCDKVYPCDSLPALVGLNHTTGGDCKETGAASGETCTLACEDGYSAADSMAVQCLNAAWTDPVGSCKASCFALPSISTSMREGDCPSNKILGDRNAEPFKHRDSCRLACEDGSSPDDSTLITCIDGEFTEPEFSCGLDCTSSPVEEMHNLGTCADYVEGGDFDMPAFEACTLACNDGYYAEPDELLITCQDNAFARQGSLSALVDLSQICKPICTEAPTLGTGMEFGACQSNFDDDDNYEQLPGDNNACNVECADGYQKQSNTEADAYQIICNGLGNAEVPTGQCVAAADFIELGASATVRTTSSNQEAQFEEEETENMETSNTATPSLHPRPLNFDFLEEASKATAAHDAAFRNQARRAQYVTGNEPSRRPRYNSVRHSALADDKKNMNSNHPNIAPLKFDLPL